MEGRDTKRKQEDEGEKMRPAMGSSLGYLKGWCGSCQPSPVVPEVKMYRQVSVRLLGAER